MNMNFWIIILPNCLRAARGTSRFANKGADSVVLPAPLFFSFQLDFSPR